MLTRGEQRVQSGATTGGIVAKRTRTLSRRTFTAEWLSTFALLGVHESVSAQTAATTPTQASAADEKSNAAVVADFCAAFGAKDFTRAASLLADNCSYRVTQTRPPLVGKAQVAETIKEFIERGAEFKVLKTVTFGPIVLNQREDIVVMTAGAAPRTFRIAAGLFFVADGKIVEWTDYVSR